MGIRRNLVDSDSTQIPDKVRELQTAIDGACSIAPGLIDFVATVPRTEEVAQLLETLRQVQIAIDTGNELAKKAVSQAEPASTGGQPKRRDLERSWGLRE